MLRPVGNLHRVASADVAFPDDAQIRAHSPGDHESLEKMLISHTNAELVAR